MIKPSEVVVGADVLINWEATIEYYKPMYPTAEYAMRGLDAYLNDETLFIKAIVSDEFARVETIDGGLVMTIPIEYLHLARV